jgi:hypothetical protein
VDEVNERAVRAGIAAELANSRSTALICRLEFYGEFAGPADDLDEVATGGGSVYLDLLSESAFATTRPVLDDADFVAA